MNTMWLFLRTYGKWIIVGVLLLSGLALFSLRASVAYSAAHAQPRSSAATPYFPTKVAVVDASMISPARFGLPDYIAGHKIIAVFTVETEACLNPQEKRVVLQVAESTSDGFLASNTAKTLSGDFEQTLSDLGISDTKNWTLEVAAGPGTSVESMLEEVNSWNASMRGGCLQLGGPIVTATPP
jgi:hypothetical protein